VALVACPIAGTFALSAASVVCVAKSFPAIVASDVLPVSCFDPVEDPVTKAVKAARNLLNKEIRDADPVSDAAAASAGEPMQSEAGVKLIGFPFVSLIGIVAMVLF
jgi:hypothetical protein